VRTRPFGPTGVEVPVIGQGTWQLRDARKAEAALRLGIELGLTHIDTAEYYRGSEEVVARVLPGRRDRLFLVSKVLPQNASYRGTLEACEKSLKRLGADRLDVYLLHWVSGDHPVSETFRAMGELADRGKIRWVGVSNHEVAELEEAQAVLGQKHLIACNQVYYDPGHRHLELELLPYCRRNRIAIVGYSPFGSGRGALPGPTTKSGRALEAVAKRHNATPHQVVLNFLARPPEVFLIPKAETEAHVRANAAALDLTLTAEDLAELERAFPRPDRALELPTL
jgi:diketogulonate reductase-like aldo/keto reductase